MCKYHATGVILHTLKMCWRITDDCKISHSDPTQVRTVQARVYITYLNRSLRFFGELPGVFRRYGRNRLPVNLLREGAASDLSIRRFYRCIGRIAHLCRRTNQLVLSSSVQTVFLHRAVEAHAVERPSTYVRNIGEQLHHTMCADARDKVAIAIQVARLLHVVAIRDSCPSKKVTVCIRAGELSEINRPIS